MALRRWLRSKEEVPGQPLGDRGEAPQRSVGGVQSRGSRLWLGLERVVSGGQTGADRAGLDAALQLKMPCGGWCPATRRADDGPLHERYPLKETPSSGYRERTEWNVRDSDGTVLLVWEKVIPHGGTDLTRKLALQYGRPCLVVDVASPPDPSSLLEWCKANKIRTLNVAGPRESELSPVYQPSLDFLLAALAQAPAAKEGAPLEKGDD